MGKEGKKRKKRGRKLERKGTESVGDKMENDVTEQSTNGKSDQILNKVLTDYFFLRECVRRKEGKYEEKKERKKERKEKKRKEKKKRKRKEKEKRKKRKKPFWLWMGIRKIPITERREIPRTDIIPYNQASLEEISSLKKETSKKKKGKRKKKKS